MHRLAADEARLARLWYDEGMSVPLRPSSVPAKVPAFDIPAGPLAGYQYLWARFARLGPLRRSL